MIFDRVNHFLSDVTCWAAAQTDMLALALIGSSARNAAKESSDVDLVLITEQPEHYLNTQDWYQQFGSVEKQQVEDYGLLTSIRVWYSDGLEVEYGITDERWVTVQLDEGTRQVIADGMRVLFEREAILSHHFVGSGHTTSVTHQEEYLEVIDGFMAQSDKESDCFSGRSALLQRGNTYWK